jgi:hypothetical protein
MQSQTNPPNYRKIAQQGLLAIVIAVVANLIVRFIMFALFDLPAAFEPLQVGAIAFFTALGVLGAALVYALVAAFTRQPDRNFRLIALVVLLLSALPNIALAAGDPPEDQFTDITDGAVLALLVFHVIAAAVSVALLTGRGGAESA